MWCFQYLIGHVFSMIFKILKFSLIPFWLSLETIFLGNPISPPPLPIITDFVYRNHKYLEEFNTLHIILVYIWEQENKSMNNLTQSSEYICNLRIQLEILQSQKKI